MQSITCVLSFRCLHFFWLVSGLILVTVPNRFDLNGKFSVAAVWASIVTNDLICLS